MLILLQFPPTFELCHSTVRFSTAMQLYCRLTGRDDLLGDSEPPATPARQSSCAQWHDRRAALNAATAIAALERQGPALDQDLSTADIEAGRALLALAEGPVYFACLYNRFAEKNGWDRQKELVRSSVPTLFAPIIVPLIRRIQIKRCATNGFANRADYAKAIGAIGGLSDALGDNLFMLGDDIQTADCGVWANLVHAAFSPTDNPARHAVRSDARLVAYLKRVGAIADWELPQIT